MHDCYSTTYPNGSAFQAWRAGFREGVKMCLDRGRKPSESEFKDAVHKRNMDHLSIWHNIGADVEYGTYAILGARMGTYKTMLTDWDYTEVQWFDNLQQIWNSEVVEPEQVEVQAYKLGEELNMRLALPMEIFTPNTSAFFKHHYQSNWYNMGPTVREIDVIRSREGW